MSRKEGWRSAVAWEQVRVAFIPDGAWRDVYVFGTNMTDWQAFLDAIRDRRLPIRFFVDGEETELPETAAKIFAIWEAHSPLLR